jgi:hypothetical protein
VTAPTPRPEVRRLPSDPQYAHLLGRHVNIDPEGRRYPVQRVADLPITDVLWERRVPWFDQQFGSCVPNAAGGCLGTDPFYEDVHRIFDPPWTQEWVDETLYHEVTSIDPFEGTWRPDDTGSDGLSICKVLRSHGWISGWRNIYTLDDAQQALMVGPFITGIRWYDSMFEPDAEGIVRISPTARMVGGHEIYANEMVLDRELMGFPNSWGPSWGKRGKFYMSFDTYSRLLAEDGDAHQFVPFIEPAPTPVDPEPATPVVPEPQPATPTGCLPALLGLSAPFGRSRDA